MPVFEKELGAAKFFVALVDETTGEAKQKAIIKCLDEGADVNQHFPDDCNNTPLHISVIIEDLEIIDLLLQRGAKIDCKNDDGKTALDVALELNSILGPVIVDLLLTFQAEKHLIFNESCDYNETIDLNLFEEDESNANLAYQKLRLTNDDELEEQNDVSQLISLILIRASLNNSFEKFFLGTRLYSLENLYDVCIRYKQDNIDGMLFLQHISSEGKENKIRVEDLWKPGGDFSLFQYCKTFKHILFKYFCESNDDVFFKKEFIDMKTCFVIHTTAEGDFKNKLVPIEYSDSSDKIVRDLILCGSDTKAYKYNHNEKDVALLADASLMGLIDVIGSKLARFIHTENIKILSEYCIIQYHILLARTVIVMSEVTPEVYRVARFRKEFLENNDVHFVSLKLSIFRNYVKMNKINKTKLCEQIENVCGEPTEFSISKLMQNVVIHYNHDKNTLEIFENYVRDVSYKLLNVKVDYDTFAKAEELASNETLSKIYFKLPACFGNIDIPVENEEKREEILIHKADVIVHCIKEQKRMIKSNPKPSKFDMSTELQKILLSALGNLLIPDPYTKTVKINMNTKLLPKNARAMLELIKTKTDFADKVRFYFSEEILPKLTWIANKPMKEFAFCFLNNLRICISQSPVEIEQEAMTLIKEYCITNKKKDETVSDIFYNAIYCHINEAVQKWSKNEDRSYFLTTKRHVIDKLLKVLSAKPLLNITSNNFINRKRKYDLKFTSTVLDSLRWHAGSGITVLLTEVSILTGFKLVQKFQDKNNYAFIDLNDSTFLSEIDCNNLIRELKCTNLKALIVFYEYVSEAKNKVFFKLIDKYVTNSCMLVTSEKAFEVLKPFIEDNIFETLRDEQNGLCDLDTKSQNKVLDNSFTFQAQKVKYSAVISNASRTAMKAKILQKIINNDCISIGKSVTNSYFEEIKYYYVPRSLHRINASTKGTSPSIFASEPDSNSNEKIKIGTLEELSDTIVIVGVPGIGKSTLLTHLSIETKLQNPSVWIVRINLLDHLQELCVLQQNKKDINQLEALKFVCKAALSKGATLSKFETVFDFDLETKRGQLIVKNCNKANVLAVFELDMFLHFYNEGKTILVFDEFDEICPHYKKEASRILQCLVERCSSDIHSTSIKQRLWIAKRPNNDIGNTLETKFVITYNLEMFSDDEQDLFVQQYLNKNIDLNSLGFEKFKNIDIFYQFMTEYSNFYGERQHLDIAKVSILFLKVFYLTGLLYFNGKIGLTPEQKVFGQGFNPLCTLNRFFNNTSFAFSNYRLQIQFYRKQMYEKVNVVFSTLNVYVVLNHFLHQMETLKLHDIFEDFTGMWDFTANVTTFYKYFIETKLKNAMAMNNNLSDLYDPCKKIIYEQELRKRMDDHKKLAFYATFKEDLLEILTNEEIQEYLNILEGMKVGGKKTVVIDSILSSGVPKFVHVYLQHYLAAEHLTDLLKAGHIEQTKLWKFILRKVENTVLEMFSVIIAHDADLRNVITDIKTKQMIFDDLTLYSKAKSKSFDNYSFEATLLGRAVYWRQVSIIKLLLIAMADVVDKNNLDKFVCMIKDESIFKTAIICDWAEIWSVIFSCIRKVDAIKLRELNPGILRTHLYDEMTNEEIIRDYKWQLTRQIRLSDNIRKRKSRKKSF